MGREIIALPCDLGTYAHLYSNLRVIKAGTLISTRKNTDIIPSHELALSTGIRKDAFPRESISLDEAVSYLHRDNLKIDNISKGWNIVTYKNVNLGFIKNLGNRINNYYPMEWRIRLDPATVGPQLPMSWQE